jgi:hypothetical protein
MVSSLEFWALAASVTRLLPEPFETSPETILEGVDPDL